MGMNHDLSPPIANNRESILTSCFKTFFLSPSIADYRGRATNSDGITGFWCIDGLA